MSKRKRDPGGETPSTSPESEESGDDAPVKDDMVHVSSDMLAGSPDIFAAKKTDTGVTPEPEPEPAEPAAAEPEAIEATGPREPAPAEAAATTAAEPEPAALAPEPAPTPPPLVTAVPQPAPPRFGGSSAALGVVLVVVGVFALVIVMAGVDLTQYGWPLFVIIPGLTLLLVGFFGVGPGATIPGGIVTMLGVVLAYQNSTGDWPSWAYAWSLIAPGGVGLGIYLQALRDRDMQSLRTGRTLMFIAAMIFVVGFILFESILGISGRDYGIFGKAALPGFLILIGVILLVRSIQRSRQA